MVADTLDRFRIVGKKDLYPSQLSGGQQQLVGVARAVIAKPQADPRRRAHRQPALRAGARDHGAVPRAQREGTTIVQVTHSEENAAYGRPRRAAARRLDRRRSSHERRCAPIARPARVLVADDQPDVLEALRLLLKAEGFELETARSPAGGRWRALEAREFDVRADGPQLRARHHLGPGGPRPADARSQALDPTLPVVVMTAWGSVDARGRGHAPRRARLRAEAVGQRAAARHRCAPRSSWRGRCAAAQRLEAENRLLRERGRGRR